MPKKNWIKQDACGKKGMLWCCDLGDIDAKKMPKMFEIFFPKDLQLSVGQGYVKYLAGNIGLLIWVQKYCVLTVNTNQSECLN